MQQFDIHLTAQYTEYHASLVLTVSVKKKKLKKGGTNKKHLRKTVKYQHGNESSVT